MSTGGTIEHNIDSFRAAVMPGTTWGLAVIRYAVNPSEYVRQLGPGGSIIDLPRTRRVPSAEIQSDMRTPLRVHGAFIENS
jgi:hypothetical protein